MLGVLPCVIWLHKTLLLQFFQIIWEVLSADSKTIMQNHSMQHCQIWARNWVLVRLFCFLRKADPERWYEIAILIFVIPFD